MRKVEVRKDAAGFKRILLNHKPLFQIGPLDQGWWPDGLYTAPTDEALRSDIDTLKKLGFNMARKHVKVEPARWYYWCDKLGFLVWQDMPSAMTRSPPTGVRKGAAEDAAVPRRTPPTYLGQRAGAHDPQPAPTRPASLSGCRSTKAGGSTAPTSILQTGQSHSIRRGWWMDRADGKIAARAT